MIVWKPDFIAWKINGSEVRRVENTWDERFQNKGQNLFMNFWQWSGGNGWGKDFDDSTMPWYIKYDSVKVESYDVKTDKFSLVFEDNFDTFDETRWAKIKGYGYETTNFYESQTSVNKYG